VIPVRPEPPPLNSVAVRVPLEELKVKFVPDLGGKLPVAAVTNRTLQEVSVLSSATVTLVEVVAVSALPVRSPVILLVIVAGNLASLIVPELMLEAFNEVNDAPPPLNEVAVIIPVIFTLPVPVMSLLLRSKSPPSCGVVSSTTLEIPPPPVIATLEMPVILPLASTTI